MKEEEKQILQTQIDHVWQSLHTLEFWPPSKEESSGFLNAIEILKADPRRQKPLTRQFGRLVSLRQVIYDLGGWKSQSGWRLSRDGLTCRFLEESSLSDSLRIVSNLDASLLTSSILSKLSDVLEQGFEKEFHALKRILETAFVGAELIRDPIQIKIGMHFVLPFIVAGLQKDRLAEAIKLLEEYSIRYSSIAKSEGFPTATSAMWLLNRFGMASKNPEDARIGEILNFDFSSIDDRQIDGKEFAGDKIRLSEIAQPSLIHDLCEAAAQQLKHEFESYFALDYFIRYRLVQADLARTPVATSGEQPSQALLKLLSFVDTKQKEGTWDQIEKFVTKYANEQLRDLSVDSIAEKLRQKYLDAKKSFARYYERKPSDDKMRSNVRIKSKEDITNIRNLVKRRIILATGDEQTQIPRLAHLLNYAEDSHSGKNYGALESYISSLGLREEDIQHPFTMQENRQIAGELEWLPRYRSRS